jgi:hypothetical protein
MQNKFIKNSNQKKYELFLSAPDASGLERWPHLGGVNAVVNAA